MKANHLAHAQSATLRRAQTRQHPPRRQARVCALLALLSVVGARRSVRADEQTDALAQRDETGLYLVLGPPSAELEAEERWASALQKAVGWPLASLEAPDPARAQEKSTPQALARYADVERLFVEARELMARFHERAALRLLAAAEKTLLSDLELPGAYAYLAEIYVQTGLCAAQLGETGLAESALARAASLDGSRHIEAAEAPPDTVAFARRVAQARATAQDSERTLEVIPKTATVWLDGEVLPTHSLLRAPSGEHLLVVRAAGHLPYAVLLRMEPGPRPALSIALAPAADEEARRALLAARTDLRAAQGKAHTLSTLRDLPIYLLWRSNLRTRQRALVYRCEPTSCRFAFGLDLAGGRHPFASPLAAHHWLQGTLEPPVNPTPHERSLWKRWPVWTAVGAAVAIGLTSWLVVRRQPQVRQERVLEIEVGPLPPPP